MDNNYNKNVEKLEKAVPDGLWKKGKYEFKKFTKMRFRKSTNIISFIFGFLIGIIIVLPLGLVMYQVLNVFKYNANAFRLFLVIVWILIMLVNGISNFFTLRIVKSYNPDMTNLQEIDDMAIFVYQFLNPGFAIFVLLLLAFFGLKFLGG
ncbi:MAG TPA: hypothetical protein PKY72_01345 [Bacilli bacterium]|nr:hypothetical protein [Acholeplasmataceae bacterium]HQO93278.1 hypothetical protein [Bacilli bacterium]HQQ38924.1 hypothetical protein [Bacilli bacterium]